MSEKKKNEILTYWNKRQTRQGKRYFKYYFSSVNEERFLADFIESVLKCEELETREKYEILQRIGVYDFAEDVEKDN